MDGEYLGGYIYNDVDLVNHNMGVNFTRGEIHYRTRV